MSNRIAVVTTTRAEYGLLYNTIKRISEDETFDLQLIVSGTHLSNDYGYTVNEIYKDGFSVAAKPDILSEAQSATDIYANSVRLFSECFEELKPSAVLMLGDRFEIMAIASVCLLKQIPIVHVSGGDTTFGAIDDACRHSVTKMASLHFTGNEQMRKRVIQLGENPSTVYNVGEPGLENMLNFEGIELNEVEGFEDFGLEAGRYAIVTYHPVTTEPQAVQAQIVSLTEAISCFPDYKFIITKANCDEGGAEINAYLERYVEGRKNVRYVASLGRVRYFSLMKRAAAVIGNSSSGIVEAPFWRVPSVNIGNRQKGRMCGKSVINCGNSQKSIKEAMKTAFSDSFAKRCCDADSLYGDGNTSAKIKEILLDFMTSGKLSCKKEFFDVEFKY